MTDSRLQELKRAWEASGSVEDEAAYLRERVRVGDLTQERLELASQCGHAAARLCVPKYHRTDPLKVVENLADRLSSSFAEKDRDLAVRIALPTIEKITMGIPRDRQSLAHEVIAHARAVAGKKTTTDHAAQRVTSDDLRRRLGREWEELPKERALCQVLMHGIFPHYPALAALLLQKLLADWPTDTLDHGLIAFSDWVLRERY